MLERPATLVGDRRRPWKPVKLLAASLFAIQCLLAQAPVLADETRDPAEPESALAATAFYYAMHDQSDFASGVVSYNRGSLHLEARYNYEDIDSGSAFIGWTFAGGGDLAFEVTPIIGLLFGSVRGVVPGVEASITYGAFDASVEAEYVHDLDQHGASYFYTWNELAWNPIDWLRVGLAGQRTRAVESDRVIERGLFAQVTSGKAHFSLYAFNPDTASRYFVAAVGVSF